MCPVGWGQCVDYRRRRKNDRYKFLCGDKQRTPASPRAAQARMSVDLPSVVCPIILTLLKDLLQGGEFVTARAREEVARMFKYH